MEEVHESRECRASHSSDSEHERGSVEHAPASEGDFAKAAGGLRAGKFGEDDKEQDGGEHKYAHGEALLEEQEQEVEEAAEPGENEEPVLLAGKERGESGGVGAVDEKGCVGNEAGGGEADGHEPYGGRGFAEQLGEFSGERREVAEEEAVDLHLSKERHGVSGGDQADSEAISSSTSATMSRPSRRSEAGTLSAGSRRTTVSLVALMSTPRSMHLATAG